MTELPEDVKAEIRLESERIYRVNEGRPADEEVLLELFSELAEFGYHLASKRAEGLVELLDSMHDELQYHELEQVGDELYNNEFIMGIRKDIAEKLKAYRGEK